MEGSILKAKPLFFPENSLIRVSIIKLIALCRNEGLTTEEDAFSKAEALFKAVQNCFDKHGLQTTQNLLELLGNIDLNSKKLPLIDEMISVIEVVTNADISNYSQLDKQVKQNLPKDCQIKMDKVKVAFEEQNNLLASLNGRMQSIIDAFEPYKDEISFYDKLSTPEGPSDLIKGFVELNQLTEKLKRNILFAPFVAQKVTELVGVVAVIYNQTINDNLERIVDIDKEQLRLAINKFKHRIEDKSIDNLLVLKDIFEFEMPAIEKIFFAFSQIQKKGPKEFNLLVNWLISDKDSKFSEYPLSLVAKIFDTFARFDDSDSSKGQAFPNELLQAFLSLDLTEDKQTETAIREILTTIFDKELSYTNEEKILLCQIALRSIKEDTQLTSALITSLVAEIKSADFATRLRFFQAIPDRVSLDSWKELNEAFADINQLDKALAKDFIDYVGQHNQLKSQFVSISKKIKTIPELPKAKKAAIISIVLKASKKENGFNEELFNLLDNVSNDVLKKLEKLYQGLNYPKAADLEIILKKAKSEATDVDVANLENQYDKDPNARRDNYEGLRLQTRQKSRKVGEFKLISEMTYNELQDLISHYDGLIAAQKLVIKKAEEKQKNEGLDQSQIIETAKKEIEKASMPLRPLTLAFQFNTSKLAYYLNNTKDLNYDRTLLLSKRQELQRWFLFINVIGKDRPIAVEPWNSNSTEAKAIKDMSYDELQGLIKHYRQLLAAPTLSEDIKIRTRLETIAILREVMFRTTDRFPRPTQILYLLSAMQNGENYVAQIKTGQGKSLTAALASALANIEGQTIDVCTANEALANEGFKENKDFFTYLGIKAKTINAGSSKEAYEEGAIHYSSMSDMALYRSKNGLLGKKFPKDVALIADEIDFSTLDDNTRYRYATSLDPFTDPKRSPYVWIYEALIDFVDTQKEELSDEDLLAEAKNWLKQVNKNPSQLKYFEENQSIYDKRLGNWLIAAAKTAKLMQQAETQETKFRVVQLENEQLGKYSKACILTGGRPNIQAEFSNGVQQFLHLRLIKKYQKEIEAGQMSPFYVEPEKTYITTLNSKIFIKRYNKRWGMTGTAGSKEEIKEQYAKYGFHFVDIPPFEPSNRQDLAPILSSASFINNPEEEQKNHIDKIVKEVLAHIKQSPKGDDGKCSPILIQCGDRTYGEKIALALNIALMASPKLKDSYEKIQQFYSSEKSNAEERAEEESEYRTNAGLNGVITISTVFDRGTDIKPTHSQGLYTIQTYVDTEPYSAEDLQRAKEQKIGRSGRAGQVGFSRLIVRRSEFKDAYEKESNNEKKLKKLKSIPQTIEGLDKAIASLNEVRNKKRRYDREMREAFDDIKEVAFQKFFPFIELINDLALSTTKKKIIRDKILTQWSIFLDEIDNQWEELEEKDKLENMAEFVAEKWANAINKEEGIIATLENFAKDNKLENFQLPAELHIDTALLLKNIKVPPADLSSYYVKKEQAYGEVDIHLTSDEVYASIMDKEPNKPEKMDSVIEEAKMASVKYHLERARVFLNSEAHRAKLSNHIKAGKEEFDFKVQDPVKLAQNIMSALLYLRYHAYRDGNIQAYAHLRQECRHFVDKMSIEPKYRKAVMDAQQRHYDILVERRGQFENKKAFYLKIIMSEWQKMAPAETAEWKSANQDRFNPLQEQIKNSLTAYRDNWWERDWVSSDRKEVVNGLLNKLNQPNMRAVDLLTAISEARKELFANDKTKKRSLSSSIDGRLFQYLDELETKIQTAMLPSELDKNIDNEFSSIALVLDAAKKLKPPINDLDMIINILRDSEQEVGFKYQVLTALFKSITMMSSSDKRFRNDDWLVFRDYCARKQNHLVYYFSQSQQLSSLNDKRSVQVYRAATQAVVEMATKALSQESVKLKPPINGIEYRERKVNFTDESHFDKKQQENSFFKRVNREESYIELLGNLEKYIVEHAHTDTKVDFEHIRLMKGSYFEKEPSFDLKIDLKINGVKTEVLYHFNMKTGTLFMDNDSLEKLDKAMDDGHERLEKDIDKSLENVKRLEVGAKIALKFATDTREQYQESLEEGIRPK
ncbi:MAG: hypothetical protein LCH30_03880 [Proteobacteria bacterium]|nr:hypothetical protein [Pseudomonadota bacterium]